MISSCENMLFDYARVEPAVSNLLLVSYPFGLYSSTVLTGVQPANASLENTLGWNVVIKWGHLSCISILSDSSPRRVQPVLHPRSD